MPVPPHPKPQNVNAETDVCVHLPPTRPQALQQELAFASYLNAQCVILPAPSRRTQVGAYARAVNAALGAAPFMEFSVRVPIYDAVAPVSVPSRSPSPAPSPVATPDPPNASRFSVSSVDSGSGTGAGCSPPESNMTTWEMWDTIRTICGYNPRLTLSECHCFGSLGSRFLCEG